MTFTRTAAPAFVLLALACAGITARPQEPTVRADPFPVASADLTIQGRAEEEPTSLLDMVLRLGELTGQHFVMSEEDRHLLAASEVPVERSLTVPASEVHSFVEALLVSSRFIMSMVRAEEPRLISVRGLDTDDRTHLRSTATTIPWEDLPIYERHPAFLVQTVIGLPNTDVRTLSNSMRAIVTDPNTLQVIPVGNSSHLILQGFGPTLAGLVRLLHLVDAESARPPTDETEEEGEGNGR